MESNSSSCCCIEEVCSDSAAAAAETKLQRMGSGGGTSGVLDPDSTASPAESAVEAESGGRKLPSSRYKGVVPQPNGRWGAQIYEKHQRVWLGTFRDESDAARAYDVAAQRFRGRDALTNFKPLSDSTDDADAAAELALLNSRSKPEIVDMLRKHTYRDELQRSRRALGSSSAAAISANNNNNNNSSSNWNLGLAAAGAEIEQLFEKTVTPSDVGKLNRLVIPKQQAEKHFPLEGCKAGVLLSFEDASGKVWRFRYSYWNSSQSYVLTKGWSRFVKEKGLRAGDIVSFHQSKPGGGGGGSEAPRQLYIGSKPRSVQTTVRLFGVNIIAVNPPLPSPPPLPLQAFKRQRLCSF